MRKLTAGHKTGEEAGKPEESPEYDLEANKSCVRPSINQVFRLKEKKRG